MNKEQAKNKLKEWEEWAKNKQRTSQEQAQRMGRMSKEQAENKLKGTGGTSKEHAFTFTEDAPA